MYRHTRSSPLATALLLLVLVTSVLWRTGMCAMQIEHVLGEFAELNAPSKHSINHDLALEHAHNHAAQESANEFVAHTVHGVLHALDSVDTHPPLFAAEDIHLPMPGLMLDQWSHHAPEPPPYPLFRPPRASRTTLS